MRAKKAYLFSNDDIQIVLSLVNVCAERHNTADTGGINLARAGTRSVHDTVFRAAEEIGGATKTVQHAGTHDTGAVGMGVDIHLNGGVHANAAQATDDLGGVGHLLRAEEKLAGIALPVVVETLESIGRETNRSRRGEVQVAAIEQVQERILQHLSPDLQVGEISTTLAQATDDSVGNVSNARLDRQQVLGQAAMVDLVLQEFNQIGRNGLRSRVLRGVGLGLVGIIRLNDSNNLLGVNRNVRSSDAVLGLKDEVRLASRRKLRHGDIVEALE